MKFAAILLCLAAPLSFSQGMRDQTAMQPFPHREYPAYTAPKPFIPPTQPDRKHPLRVGLLLLNNNFNGEQYEGNGKLFFIGNSPYQYHFTYLCNVTFMSGNDFIYQARWVKPYGTLEVLFQSPTSSGKTTCKLKTTSAG